jgi:hypothetical protein
VVVAAPTITPAPDAPEVDLPGNGGRFAVTAAATLAIVAAVVWLLASFEPPNLHRTTPPDPTARLVACGPLSVGREVEGPSGPGFAPERVRLPVLAGTVRLKNPTGYPRNATVSVAFGRDSIPPGTLTTQVPARSTVDVIVPAGDNSNGEDGNGDCTVRTHFEP